jgi:hypothetical protein
MQAWPSPWPTVPRNWTVELALVYAKHALKDAPKLSAAGLKAKAQALLAI